MVKFNKPTLVTFTAPTCSGKTYILNQLVEKHGFNRIVSTTTRQARSGEKEGVDYHFIDRETSIDMEKKNKFFELVEFNSVRYGVTNHEMDVKMKQEAPPLVILEPNGLDIYTKKCYDNNWGIFKIYVHATESVRLDRLTRRTLSSTWDVVDSLKPSPGKYTNTFFDVGADEAKKTLSRVVNEHHRRMQSMLRDEVLWINQFNWDLVVPGDDAETAIQMILDGVALRNKRIDAGLY